MIKKIAFPFILVLLLSSCELTERRIHSTRVNSAEELNDFLLYGWNTWNNPNLLSQVLMPQGLSLRISMRDSYRRGSPYYLDEAYISSPFHRFTEQVEPYNHTYDGSFTDLKISWKGVTARIKTATRRDNIYILYIPEEVPEYPPVLILEAGILWNKGGVLEKKENIIQADMGTKSITIGATRNDSLIPLPLSSPYLSFSSADTLAFFTGRRQSLEWIQDFISDKEQEILEDRSKYGDYQESYNAMQTLLAWNLIYDPFKGRAITPVSRIWNENWGGWVLFDWDTYFTAAMYAVDNKFHAYANALAITNEITEEGFIPNYSGTLLNRKSFDRSQPPVGSLITKMIFDKYGEKWFLESSFENLLTWNRWWEKERDNQGFLSWGSDPHPLGHKANTRVAAMLESGLDNSPLFDSAVFNPEKNMLELASVGLMGMYIADCKALAEIATILEKPEVYDELMQRALRYSAKLGELWDEKSGIYRDLDLVSGDFSDRLAPTCFYPLLAGVPSQAQAERMVKEYLLNPEKFYGEYMIPSISRDDPAFGDNTYWRGRIWAPMNFLVYLGLRNYDLPEARKLLADKSNELLMKEWKNNRRVYENYNAVTGEGPDVRNSDGFYSWGGLLGLIALMEAGYWDETEN